MVSPKAQAFSGCGNREEQRRETLHYRQINIMKTKLNFLLRTAFSVVSFMLFAAGVAPSVPAASFRGLGDLPGGNFFSVATAVSADGRVIVGNAKSINGTEAFRWTAATGMVGLGDLSGGTFSSFANAVSADGSVVVGDSISSNGRQAFRWTQATGTGLIQENEARLGSGIFVAGNRGSAALEPGPARRGLPGNRRQTERWAARAGKAKSYRAPRHGCARCDDFLGPPAELTLRSELG